MFGNIFLLRIHQILRRVYQLVGSGCLLNSLQARSNGPTKVNILFGLGTATKAQNSQSALQVGLWSGPTSRHCPAGLPDSALLAQGQIAGTGPFLA
jgi:hypothetical protein